MWRKSRKMGRRGSGERDEKRGSVRRGEREKRRGDRGKGAEEMGKWYEEREEK